MSTDADRRHRMTALVWHRQQLEKLRDEYTNRRSVPRQLLDRAVALVDSTVTELQARHEAQLEEIDYQHQQQLARAEQQLARSEQRAADATDRVRALEAMRTNLREIHETIDDGVLVKITAPRTATWDGKESGVPRPWTLGELETLIYRLRAGGGTDDTEVRVKHDHTEATIPYPELVLDAPPPPWPAPVAVEPARSWWRRRGARRWATAAGIAVALNLLVLLIGRVA